MEGNDRIHAVVLWHHFLGYLCFFLMWGESVSLDTAAVNASIVSKADERRQNEYRTPVKKNTLQGRPNFDNCTVRSYHL